VRNFHDFFTAMKLFLLLAVIASAQATNFANTKVAECQTCSDGKKVAGGTGCYCGSNGVFTAATEFCYIRPTANASEIGNKLTAALCDNTDGSVAATAACMCGTNSAGAEIAIAVGEWCVLHPTTGLGVKLTAKSCPHTDGTTPTGVACRCGLDAAGTAQGLSITGTTNKCFVASNGHKGVATHADGVTPAATSAGACANQDGGANAAICKCGKDGVHVTAAQFCNVGINGEGVMMPAIKCPHTDGTTPTGVACACGLDAAGTGAGLSITGTTNKCFVASNGHKGVATHADGTTPAATSAGACSSTVGAAVSAICKCGKDGVHVAADEFCILDKDGLGVKLTTKACTNTLSTAATDAACICGLDAAGTAAGASHATGKFCFTSFSGVGSAADAAVLPATSCPAPASVSPAGVAAPGIVATLLAAVAVALRM
jgi:hypothetical protein